MCLLVVAVADCANRSRLALKPTASPSCLDTGKEADAKFHRGEYTRPNIVKEDPAAAGRIV
jgi:hypothetical protein